MKNLAIQVAVGLLAVGSSATLAQSTTVRARTNPTVITPARVPQETTVVTPATPATRARLPDSATEVVPDRSVNPRNDRITDKPRINSIPHAPELAAVWQPLNTQVEVFGIDAHGAIRGMWKHENFFWEASFNLSGPGTAPPGAPLAAVWQPLNEQLEVFTVSPNGQLLVSWKAHNGRWLGPNTISRPNFAPPGAHVTAVFQPVNNQLEVFAIDPAGAVRLVWKVQNGKWQESVALTAPGAAPPGAPITAVWQPLNEQLEVFWIGTDGALRGIWKQHNGRWQPPFTLSPAGFTNPRARIAAVWQPLNEQLELFVVDKAGGINVIWKAHNGRWFAPYVLGGPQIARPGGDIVAAFDAQTGRMQVVTAGNHGELIHAWKMNNGAWKPGPGAYSAEFAKPGPAGTWLWGASLAGVTQQFPFSDRFFVFTIDDDQAVTALRSDGISSSRPLQAISRANFGPIYGTHAAYCSGVLRQWSGGYDPGDEVLQSCIDYMGITAYCDRQDAGVGIGYPPQREWPRYLQCNSRSHPEDVIEQAEHIATGVAEGLKDAAVATVVYSPEILQGAACVNGAAFACASLAVSLAARAIELPPEIKDAVDLATDASGCVNGDVVSCARLGAAGARAAGVAIPGEEAGQIAGLAQACVNEDYGACLRLGEKAAMAAGVPLQQVNQAAKNAQDCYSGDVDACIALGRQAAKAGIPVGGVADGADNMRQCSYGSLADCQQLGQALAAIPR
ncbi:MAG: hypothetical protein ABI821_09110 [Pseudomonadota bacterium]